MRFFFNLPCFLVIVIGVVKVHKIIIKIVINIKIGISEDNILNINKNDSLIIIIISINDNNIK